MAESNPDLESFREQWRREVAERSNAEGNKDLRSKQSNAGPSRLPRKPPAPPRIASEKVPKPAGDEDEPEPIHRLDGSVDDVGEAPSKEPQSALEHYEKAVERETSGNLGDSLDHYRKAFRLDNKVDQKYKNKHFPPSSASKPTNPNPSNASVTVRNTAHHSLDGPPLPIKQLIAGFSRLSIEPAAPEIEGTPAPPCPLAGLPDEILVQIFMEVAITDVASFVRLAQVCKKMAFLVATEEQIWKRVCHGEEVGFGAMHYSWQRELLGGPLEDEIPIFKEGEEDIIPPLSNESITETLLKSAYSSSWHQMFRLRPRIRYNGCYISTVNYVRPGQASVSQVSWNAPIHVVTYYRYLRFFRDGTLISLLTTSEPSDVVHHLTKELTEAHRGGAQAFLPSAMMQNALRGRWRLSSVADNAEVDMKEAEGDVYIETEGVGPKYMYRMELSLRTAGKAARNNKLVWKGFWNYNRLTDDWGEFTLRNDKPFFFSRVKCYGMGA